MMKSVSVFAIMMALSMTAAVAKDLKQDQKTAAPAVKAEVMSDSEMDRVTAGFTSNGPGFGRLTASDNTNNVFHSNPGIDRAFNNAPNGIGPGCGRNTITGC
jgi:hypothetical protein